MRLAAELREREERLGRACEIANADADIAAIEQDWDNLPHETGEPWSDASAG